MELHPGTRLGKEGIGNMRTMSINRKGSRREKDWVRKKRPYPEEILSDGRL